jgi:hypothetical protein
MVEVSRDVRALECLTLAQLQHKHVVWFGVETRTKNKAFLKKKLAFRIQERTEGGISPEAQARIQELAPTLLPERKEAKQRPIKAERSEVVHAAAPARDLRLPKVGTLLRREYQGTVHEVEVLSQGFRFRNQIHKSLSSIAKIITGTNWNGFLFFGLIRRDEKV